MEDLKRPASSSGELQSSQSPIALQSVHLVCASRLSRTQLMFKLLYTRLRSIWEPQKPSSIMDYPFNCVLGRQYKDPDKISQKLNELLGENGWSGMEVSVF